jgi:drug/metabolite transporter (DMT)-like permease
MQALWMILASLAFSTMGVCIKLGSASFSTGEVVFYRSVVAFLLLQGFVLASGKSLRTPHFRAHLLRSAVGFSAMALYFATIARIPLATAVTLVYTSPLFMGLFLLFWYRESVCRASSFYVLIGFVGVVALLQPTLAREQWLGGAMGLASGFATSIAFLNIRRLGGLGEPEWRTVYFFSAFTTLAGLIWVLGEGGFSRPDAHGAWLMLGVGCFGTLGQMSMTAAFKRGKTLMAANLSYLTPVFATLFGLLLWQELPTVLSWAGMALTIASGMAITAVSRDPPPEPD